MNTQPDPAAFTIAQVASALYISQRTVRRLLSSGKLRSLRIGRLVRVPAESLRQFVEGVEGTQSNETESKSTDRANGRTDVRNTKEFARETQEQQP